MIGQYQRDLEEEENIDEIIETDPDEAQHHPIVDAPDNQDYMNSNEYDRNSNVQNMDELNQFHGEHQRVGSGDIDYMRDSRYFNRDHGYEQIE
jgi:hypothetical protein